MSFSTAQQEMLAGGRSGMVFHLFHLAHPDGALRLSTLPFDWIDAAAATWLGGGLVLDVSEAVGQIEGAPPGLTVTLSGADTGLLAYALDGKIKGVRLTRYLAFADDAGAQVGSVVTVFKGWCETPEIVGDPEQPTVSITAESRLLRLRKPRPVFATPEDHARFRPADTASGFELVTGLQDKSVQFDR